MTTALPFSGGRSAMMRVTSSSFAVLPSRGRRLGALNEIVDLAGVPRRPSQGRGARAFSSVSSASSGPAAPLLYVLEVQILQQRGVGLIHAGFEQTRNRPATLRRLAARAAVEEAIRRWKPISRSCR